MRIMALDSSGLTATVAIAEEERLIAEYTLTNGLTHSQTLLPMLEEIKNRVGQDLAKIDAIAVSGGPGSFTGLRIGSATAKGIGLALGKPIVSVSTLEALAYHAPWDGFTVCPMMNARRSQVYTALYHFEEGRAVPVLEPVAEPVEEMIRFLNERGESVVLLGDGAEDYRDILQEGLRIPCQFAPLHLRLQRAGALCAAAFVHLKDGEKQTAREHRPVYLRVSQAERERALKEQAEKEQEEQEEQ